MAPDHSPETLTEPVYAAKLAHAELPGDLVRQLQRDYETDARELADRWEQIDLSVWPHFEHLSGR